MEAVKSQVPNLGLRRYLDVGNTHQFMKLLWTLLALSVAYILLTRRICTNRACQAAVLLAQAYIRLAGFLT